MKINYPKLLVCIGICFGVAFAGSTFTPLPGSEWYYHFLQKPAWNPPDWLFPPAWTLLFLLMGTALYLVSEKQGEKKSAYILFGVQLLLNLSWSAVFFGLHSPGAALLVIITLWTAILLTILSFRKISQAAGYLLLPYILWVSFASFLNFTIWRLN
ncbi:MAG: tryptophan-rich sensory protein [Chlorobiaceae bacterium]|nr:tryptophan-rich sensory protein [Chlorobiaceae bacterium]